MSRINPDKWPMLSAEKKIEILRQEIGDLSDRIGELSSVLEDFRDAKYRSLEAIGQAGNATDEKLTALASDVAEIRKHLSMKPRP